MNDEVQQPVPATAKKGGKRLSEVEKTKNDASSNASNVARQLAFAGIATVWLLREESARPLGDLLLLALLALSLTLVCDLSQYVYCSHKWRNFYNEQYEIHNSDDALIDIPDELSARMYHFFRVKIALLAIGYAFLIASAVIKLRIL